MDDGRSLPAVHVQALAAQEVTRVRVLTRMYGSAAAATYDELTGRHLRSVLRAVRGLGVAKGPAIDVGCGTGALVRELRQRGFHSTGIDASPHMVRIANRIGPRGAYVVGDAAHFGGAGTCVLVTATFDVTNHLLTAPRLSKFFACAARALAPGGALLFDTVTPHDIDCNWEDYLHYTRRPSWRLVRTGRRVGPATGEIEYDFFVRSGRSSWRHHHEAHRLRAWSRAEIQRRLEVAGFRRIRCVDAATLRAPGRRCVRWLFTAHRS